MNHFEIGRENPVGHCGLVSDLADKDPIIQVLVGRWIHERCDTPNGPSLAYIFLIAGRLKLLKK